MRNEDKPWLDWRAKFADIYDESNYASASQSKLMALSHCMAEKCFHKDDHFANVLEIGAGTGEHLVLSHFYNVG
jgi:phosphatidylethanolamine/phosphatidyl-N-methylethanolamine N-methyltransferase